MAEAREDWNRDREGADCLDAKLFHNALFELCELYVDVECNADPEVPRAAAEHSPRLVTRHNRRTPLTTRSRTSSLPTTHH